MQSNVSISLHTLIYSIQRPIVCKDVMRYNYEPYQLSRTGKFLK